MQAAEDPGQTTRRSFLYPPIAAAVAVAVLSSRVQWSYDEAIWLAVARRVAQGGRLYVDIIDHKPPTVFAMSWLLDVLPGPYVVARAVAVGLAMLVIWMSAARLSRFVGAGPKWSQIIGGLSAASVVFGSSLVLTVELIAVSLLFASLSLVASDRWAIGALMMGLAAAFDVRAVLLLPAALVLTYRRGGVRGLSTAAAVLMTGALLGLVLFLGGGSSVRFALVDLNVASRRSFGGWPLGSQLATCAEVLLPVLVLIILAKPSPAREARVGWMLAGGALLIAIGSVLPFSHYWAYTALALPFLLVRPRATFSISPLLPISLLLAAFVPLVALTINHAHTSNRAYATYLAVAETLNDQLAPDETFVEIDNQPYLSAMLSSHFVMRSPVLGYVLLQTTRQHELLDELSGQMGTASVLVEDGVLETPEPDIPLAWREVVSVAKAAVPSHACDEPVLRIRLHWKCTTAPTGS